MDLSQFASGASGSPPAAPASPDAGYPSNGDPGTGTPATVPGDYWFYQIQAEFADLMDEVGITPDHETLTQLVSAIYAMIVKWFQANDGSGWMKMPNGVIFQWGSGLSDGSGVATFTHPLTFPTAGAKAVCTVNTGGLAAFIVSVGAIATTNTVAYVANPSSAAVAGATVHFFVIGS